MEEQNVIKEQNRVKEQFEFKIKKSNHQGINYFKSMMRKKNKYSLDLKKGDKKMLTKEEANKMIAWEEEIETEMYGKGTSWAFIFKEKILQKWQEEGLVEKDKRNEIIELSKKMARYRHLCASDYPTQSLSARDHDIHKLIDLIIEYFEETK